MHKIIFFFSEKKENKKNMCLPYLKFSDTLPETHLFFLIGLSDIMKRHFSAFHEKKVKMIIMMVPFKINLKKRSRFFFC